MKLYGIPLSNYTNMVKHALLEKDLSFEEVSTPPSQGEDFLAKSPMGKVPALETERGFLTETDAIFDYLEEAFPGTRLFPEDAFDRAKIRQLMKTQELYVETPFHNLVGVLFGREVPDHVKEASRANAAKGLAALERLARFDPWVGGETFTFADIFAFYSFVLSDRLAQMVYQWEILGEVPGLAQWYERFAVRDVTARVMADSQAAAEAMAARAG